jgi:hypothetical protein
MPINIHGKEYVTVAERVAEAHKDQEKIDILTEVLFQEPVVVKAIVTTSKGVFSGISAANPSKAIEKMSPYEVAETSAVGRALGFAGYGLVDSIATADEMVKAGATSHSTVVSPSNSTGQPCPVCQGPTWDNRTTKTNPKQPDFKCKNSSCKGVIWPPKNAFPHYDAEGNGLTEEQHKEYVEPLPPIESYENIDISEVEI